jgi:hypothetical protein
MKDHKAKAQKIAVPDKEWLSMSEAITALTIGKAMTWNEFGQWGDAQFGRLKILLQQWRKETEFELHLTSPLDKMLGRLNELRANWPRSGKQLYTEARKQEQEARKLDTAFDYAIRRLLGLGIVGR